MFSTVGYSSTSFQLRWSYSSRMARDLRAQLGKIDQHPTGARLALDDQLHLVGVAV